MRELAELAAGALLTLAVGWSALRAAAGLEPGAVWPRLALAWVVGLSLMVTVALPLALLGMPVEPLPITVLSLVLLGVFFLLHRNQIPGPPTTNAAAEGEGVSRAGAERSSEAQSVHHHGKRLRGPGAGDPLPLRTATTLLLLAAAALFLWKLAATPLWSWDHLAVYGLKSRRMVVDGRLDLSFLAAPTFVIHAHYPVGLPMAWRVLTLGGMPGALAFKLAHALFALALLGLTRHGARLLGRSAALADALAAFLLVTPLFWDTVAVGLADLTIGLWATAALVVALAARGGPAGPLWLVGLLLGFLPWLKEDGLVLSGLVLLAAALLLWRDGAGARSVRLAALALPYVLLLGLGQVIGRVWLPYGWTFLTEDPWSRALARFARPGEILAALGADLAAPDWLGFWLAFTVAILVAAARRDGLALLLCGIVAATLAVYSLVYFFTVLDPIIHMRSSYTRITAALVPLGLLAMSALLAPTGDRGSARPTERLAAPQARPRRSGEGRD